jgi:hypothetical protein
MEWSITWECWGHRLPLKLYLLDREKLAAAKKEFDKMEQENKVQRSTSHWLSPLHMVQKAIAGDYVAIFPASTWLVETDTYILDFARRLLFAKF